MKTKDILSWIFSFFLCQNILPESVLASEKENNILIAYYSRSGNTERVARYIGDVIAADFFEIEEKDNYPTNYKELTKIAKKEIQDNYKPELKNYLPSIDKYNVIFIGSPCWWGTYAPPVVSFLSKYNFSNKKVIFFMTHGGSGLGHSLSDLRTIIPEANIISTKAFYGSHIESSEKEIKSWVKELGYE